MASGSERSGSGSRLTNSTAASRRTPQYQSTNPRSANYVPF